ncbi:hypothetical protein [Spirillospora sp. CA-128828]|uniref:hypothetical protein n=1 Tax=Spirillospora sp. CA-128828 TaxID=3240033 RepID=UPI003D922E47
MAGSWKHGWIPLTPGAVLSKNHGRKPGGKSKLGQKLAGMKKSSSSGSGPRSRQFRPAGGPRPDSGASKSGAAASTGRKPHSKAALAGKPGTPPGLRQPARNHKPAPSSLAEENYRLANMTAKERIAERKRQDREATQEAEHKQLENARRAQAAEDAERQKKLDAFEAAQGRRDETHRAAEARRAAEKVEAEKKRKAEEAEEQERARRAEGAQLARRGAWLYRRGEYDEAIEHMKRAAATDPGRRDKYEDLIRQIKERRRKEPQGTSKTHRKTALTGGR